MESKRSSKVKPASSSLKSTGSLNIFNQNNTEDLTVRPPTSFSLNNLVDQSAEIKTEKRDGSIGSAKKEVEKTIKDNNNEGTKKLDGVRIEITKQKSDSEGNKIILTNDNAKQVVDDTNPENCMVGKETVHKTDSEQSTETICRICHDNPAEMSLIQPCSCKGSMGLVHQECLEHWLGESGKTSCEICGFEYIITRKPKYTGISSFFAWIRHPTSPNDTKNLFFDLACFFVLTPLASVSAWLCILGSQHYSNGLQAQIQTSANGHRYGSRMDEGSNSRWTSIGLLTLTVTLLSAYYIWLFVAFKYHYSIWKTWQGRNYIVKVLPITQDKINAGNGVASNVREKAETGDDFSVITPQEQDPSEVSSDYTLSSVVIQTQPGSDSTSIGISATSSNPEVVLSEYK